MRLLAPFSQDQILTYLGKKDSGMCNLLTIIWLRYRLDDIAYPADDQNKARDRIWRVSREGARGAPSILNPIANRVRLETFKETKDQWGARTAAIQLPLLIYGLKAAAPGANFVSTIPTIALHFQTQRAQGILYQMRAIDKRIISFGHALGFFQNLENGLISAFDSNQGEFVLEDIGGVVQWINNAVELILGEEIPEAGIRFRQSVTAIEKI